MTIRLPLSFALGAALIAAPFAWAGPVPDAARAANVLFLGEVHDNPTHHAVQAAWVEELQPGAIVFEMIEPDVATRITDENRQDAERLAAVLAWEESGWPDFEMYYPIFTAAPAAAIFGAGIPREEVEPVMNGDFSVFFSEDQVRRLGLDQPLAPADQAAREALQAAAHCDALPEELLPAMVAVQRARDAALAHAVLQAVDAGLTPVAVITGNGHVRADWGAPAVLARAAPDLEVFVLAQSEEGRSPEGGFDIVVDAPAPDRPDPCDAFR